MAHCQTLNSYFVPRALSWSWKLKSPLLVKLASASVGISPKLKYNLASTPLGVLEVLAISYNILSLISDTLTKERHCEQRPSCGVVSGQEGIVVCIVWSGVWIPNTGHRDNHGDRSGTEWVTSGCRYCAATAHGPAADTGHNKWSSVSQCRIPWMST